MESFVFNLFNRSLLPILFIIFTNFSFAEKNPSFPLRVQYKNLEFISSESLVNHINDYLIIDVRSQFEFKILHIEKAINIPISNMGFIPSLNKLIEEDHRDIVFYCNGVTCKKSYFSAVKSKNNKISNVKVYDAGIHEWAQKHPIHSILLGTAMKSNNELITDSKFLKHCLTSDKFFKKIDNNTWVIDIRDHFQRDIKILHGTAYHSSLDDISVLLNKAKNKKIRLLIFDAVGKQVRWLQYILEKEGFDEYYFLNGGVAQLSKELNN